LIKYILKTKKCAHLTKRTGNTVEAELHFFYDAQSKPAFVEYNGTKYRYIHNLQGDIVAIVDAAGNPVVEYKYDAWGTILSRTGTMKDNLGYANPFRYREYIFDNETLMYWLRSRYYYPELHRFISSDSVMGSLYTLGSTKLFAYCCNSPIGFADPQGTFAIPIAKAAYTIGVGILMPFVVQGLQKTRKNSSNYSKTSLKTRLLLAAIAIDATYSSIRDRTRERTEEQDRTTTIANRYRIDGAPYFSAMLSDDGIIIFGEPMSFEVALGYARSGENIWTAQQGNMMQLAMAVAAIDGYSVTPPEKGSIYRECWHFHLRKGRQKHPTHFFFGSENVTWM